EIARPIAVHAVAQPWVTETAKAAIRNTMRISFLCILGSGIHRSYAILSREKKDLRDKFFTELYTIHSLIHSFLHYQHRYPHSMPYRVNRSAEDQIFKELVTVGAHDEQ